MWKLILLILAGLYTLNPYDIFPDLMVGWGWIDDIIIWILLWRYISSRKNAFTRNQRFYEQARGKFAGNSKAGSSTENQYKSNNPDAEDVTPWDPHRILGIEPNASVEQIKQAYRELASRYHPDKLEHLGEEFKTLAEKRFKEIQQAYQELKGKGG
jgi:DnaJ like chaperone protein